jgi:hypothetical protein
MAGLFALLELKQNELGEQSVSRYKCQTGSGWYNFKTADCWKFSFEDMFTNRFAQLQRDAAELNRQKTEFSQTRSALDAERSQRLAEAAQTRDRITQLEADRRRLEILDQRHPRRRDQPLGHRAVLSRAEIVIRQRLAGDIEMLRTLLPALDKTGPAPAFDDYEKEDIRSLRDTMVDFSRSIDAGRNFLTSDVACG